VASQFSVAATTGGVTAAKGFTAAGLHCGIKAKAGALDLGCWRPTGPCRRPASSRPTWRRPRR
jgi:hypothetical protein